MRTPITDQMRSYIAEKRYPLHMPGHKGRLCSSTFARERCGFWGFDSIYDVDITEIPDMDDLHCPEGMIAESMSELVRVYGTKRSYYMVNGSSGGLLAALCASGGPVLAARNCHKSVFHAIGLMKCEAEYLYPDVSADGICAGIRADQVKEKLEKMKANGHPARTLVLTSPTYEGIGSDIAGIVKVAHAMGVTVIVDEAHGAHLPFMRQPDFMTSAIYEGADLVIQSLHKTLPAPTQTAILHLTDTVSDALIGRLEYMLNVFQSSSPSYVFMIAMENAVAYMDGLAHENGLQCGTGAGLANENELRVGCGAGLAQKDERWSCQENTLVAYQNALVGFRKKMEDAHLKALYLLKPEGPVDPSKWVIMIRPGYGNGVELEECLRRQYHFQLEMASDRYCIAMTSVCDDLRMYEQFADALVEIDARWAERCETAEAERCETAEAEGRETAEAEGREAAEAEGSETRAEGLGRTENAGNIVPCMAGKGLWDFAAYVGPTALTIGQALEKKSEWVTEQESIGRVCADFLYVYPPGIPFAVPGEVVTENLVKLLEGLEESRLKLYGPQFGNVQKNGQKTIRVLY